LWEKTKSAKQNEKMSREHGNGKSIGTRGYRDMLGDRGVERQDLRRRERRGRDFPAGAQHVDEEPVFSMTQVQGSASDGIWAKL
jgi:hypothetical protein